MTAYALDESHDLYVRGGQVARATGADFVVQAIRTRLLLYRGEWWLDLSAGVPWFEEILGWPGALRTAEVEIRRSITETPGVTELVSFDVQLDRRARDLRITFEVLTEYGPSDVETVTIA